MTNAVDSSIKENGPSNASSDDQQDSDPPEQPVDNHVQVQEAAANDIPQTCIRVGCPNRPVVNSEWEDEYCSNECVVSHCRDIFSCWVTSNQNATVK